MCTGAVLADDTSVVVAKAKSAQASPGKSATERLRALPPAQKATILLVAGMYAQSALPNLQCVSECVCVNMQNGDFYLKAFCKLRPKPTTDFT